MQYETIESQPFSYHGSTSKILMFMALGTGEVHVETCGIIFMTREDFIE